MKLLVCLSLLLVVTTAEELLDDGEEHKSVFFGYLGDMLSNGTAALKHMVYNFVIEEDGSAYKFLVQHVFDRIEPQFCPVNSPVNSPKNKKNWNCNATTNWLFGCTCRNEFRELGKTECKTAPCDVFRLIERDGPEALSEFVNADSYADKMKVLVDYLVTPLSRILCGCPYVFKAAINCVKNYDGQLFEMGVFNISMSQFEDIVQEVDWKTAKGIFKELAKVSCGEYKGEDCIDEFGKNYVALGTFLDNTFSGQDPDNCMSMIRAEAEFINYVNSFSGPEPEDNADINFKAYVEDIVDAFVEMERVLMCDTGCADEIQENFFNSCCGKRWTERLVEKDMRNKYEKLYKSIAKVFHLPLKLKKAMNKYLSIFDPETFCGDEVDAYRDFNEQCNAIEA